MIDFHRHAPCPSESEILVVEIPKGINTKQELFNVVAERLSFPAYFGNNWDALDEGLADLSWLDEQTICFWHEDIPLERDSIEVKRYIRLLNEISEKANKTKITVNFPNSVREKIIDFLAS